MLNFSDTFVLIYRQLNSYIIYLLFTFWIPIKEFQMTGNRFNGGMIMICATSYFEKNVKDVDLADTIYQLIGKQKHATSLLYKNKELQALCLA